MVSGRIHEKWGKKLLNFSEKKIDELIDKKNHDKGRYNEKILRNQVEYVRKNWNSLGVKYYILHHLLDIIYEVVKEILHPEKLNEEVCSDLNKFIAIVWEEFKRKVSELKPFYEVAIEEDMLTLMDWINFNKRYELIFDVINDAMGKIREMRTRYYNDKEMKAEIELDEELNKMKKDIEDLKEIMKKLKSFDYNRELIKRKKEIEEERRKKWNCILELKEKLRRKTQKIYAGGGI